MSVPLEPRAAETADRRAREIEHDKKIASRAEVIWNWSSPAGRGRADRRATLLAEASALAPGRRALELGCGTGVFLERTARTGATIFGVDLSSDLLLQARARVGATTNVSLILGDAERLPLPDRSLDAVYGSSILHHLNLEPALREAFRALRPGGTLAFAEPNLINPQIAFSYLIGPRDYFGLSPDEMAFTRFHATRVLERIGYAHAVARPFDFLHPAVPAGLVPAVARLSPMLERVPLLTEIAGSLLITAVRP